MKLKNVLMFIIPAILAAIFTYLIGVRTPAIALAFFIIFDAVISIISSFIFITYWHKSKKYSEFLKKYQANAPELGGTLAIVIPVFNESPWTVVQTAISAKMALENMGEVYVLDDSTQKDIQDELDSYAEQYDFKIFRRNGRSGFKAGAVNAWLEKHGDEYEFLMILDADQRPLPGLGKKILKAFEDPKVAFVQVPQYYSRTDNTISLGAHLQLIPFLRVVMRARHLNGSAFSLGSGTIFRVKHLKEVGGLYDKTVTEDIYTSVLLHEKGLKSVYLDIPGVWYGEAPLNLKGFWIQQNRWASGGFQLTGKLLDSKLSTTQLLDYMMGVFYWLHVGPLTIIDIAAPILFLIFGIYFMSVNPVFYLVVYGALFAFTFIFYIISMHRYRYGLREYVFHQSTQLIASLPVTAAFLQWLTHRKKGFNVTPKNQKHMRLEKPHLYMLSIAILLAIATSAGAFNIIRGNPEMRYAYAINTFWAAWWLAFSISAFYVSLGRNISEKTKNRAKQSYEGLEQAVIELLLCGAELEKTVGRYYTHVANLYPEHSDELIKLARDSFKHSRIYLELLNYSIKLKKSNASNSCVALEEYLSGIKNYRQTCENSSLKDCMLQQEEILMYVYAQLTFESCQFMPASLREQILEIMHDELKHDEIVKTILARPN